MGQFLAAIIALGKSVKAVRDILDQLTSLWLYTQNQIDENQSANIKREREKILTDLKTPGLSDETVRTLRRRLHDLRKQ